MKRNITLDGPPPATGERVTPTTRELAQRLSGTDEILLLWHAQIERVELSILDQATGVGFHIEVAPADAIDAFYHPYAYAAGDENTYRVEQDERTNRFELVARQQQFSHALIDLCVNGAGGRSC